MMPRYVYVVAALVVMARSTTEQHNSVKFPNDPFTQEKDETPQPQTRFGSKYLGYFLSLLSSSFGSAQASPIQTPGPPATTSKPSATPLTLFSVLPNSSGAMMSPTTTMRATSVPPPADQQSSNKVVTNVPQGASTFPTAYPTSFPTGIITSYVTFPPVVAPKPPEPSAPLLTTGGTVCGCLPAAVCVNQTTRSGLSVRIVTPPPSGVTCPSGLVYCCSPNVRHLCGLRNVIPGVTPGSGQANLGEFPWSAIILTEDDTYVGGGALIDSLHVITAAHKVATHGNGAKLKVRLGDWDLSKTSEPVSHLDVKVNGIARHPKFDAVNLKDDLAILSLATPVPTLAAPRPQINTICLPKPKDMFVGSRCWVAGWGKDQFDGAYQQIIKKVDLPVIAPTECQNRLRQTRLGSSFVLDSATFLCAGGEATKDACTGDGGNALACESNGQFYVAGITVGGIECGLANVPGLYVNLVNYLPWIDSVVQPPAGIDPRRKPSH